ELEGGCWLGDGEEVVLFEVLVLARTRRRLQELWRVTREKVSSDRWGWYSFASFDILESARFGEAVWVTAKNESASLLCDDAYTDPADQSSTLPGTLKSDPSDG